MKLRLLALALLLSFPITAAHAQTDKLIQIIIDNSSALRNPEQGAAAYGGILVFKARELQGVAGRNAKVHIVTTHNPRTIYDGEARRLFGSLQSLVAPQIKHQPEGCNQLGEAIERVRAHIARHAAKEVEIYVISSLIPTGAPCKNLRIKLPQPVPPNVDYQSLLQPQTTLLQFFWADRQQENVWAKAIEASGMLERIRNQGVDYAIRGEDSTRQYIADRINQ
jgi:hypothetical protein